MYTAKNMENAWEFCKVYKQITDTDGYSPSEEYWKWAKDCWKKLNCIEARKTIYGPLYAKYVEQTNAYKKLNDIYIK